VVDPKVIEEYASLMAEGIAFPPVTAWFDGTEYWLTDGFQRVAASTRAGRDVVTVEIHHGTIMEARWHSYAANAVHGLRRTEAETQNVIQLALQHPNAAGLSNVKLAQHLQIPEATVRRWRRKLSSSRDEDDIRIVTRGKSTYAMRTKCIGQDRVGRRTKTRAELRRDLAEMKEHSSPEARRLLNIITNWAIGSANATECLGAIECAIREVGRMGASHI
jgi:hypothetical protein